MDNKPNVNLKNVPGFFKNKAIWKILEVYNITTLEELFNAFNDDNFINNFTSSLIILKEISATIKLLRCKYLGEDSGIVINADTTIEEIVDKLGLSVEIEEELTRIKRGNDFFCKLSKKTLQQKQDFIRMITNLSEESIEELSYRLQIINDYEKQKEEDVLKKNIAIQKQLKERNISKTKSKKEETEVERETRLKAVMQLHPRANIISTETEEERLKRLGSLVSSLPAFKGK